VLILDSIVKTVSLMRYWTLCDEIVYNVKAMSDVKHKVVDRLARKCDIVAKCVNATCWSAKCWWRCWWDWLVCSLKVLLHFILKATCSADVMHWMLLMCEICVLMTC